jgi:hypothetical protein
MHHNGQFSKTWCLVVKVTYLKYVKQLGTVAHACNPSYSGDKAQEDQGSKTAQTNSSPDPILKNLITQKGLVKWFKM